MLHYPHCVDLGSFPGFKCSGVAGILAVAEVLIVEFLPSEDVVLVLGSSVTFLGVSVTSLSGDTVYPAPSRAGRAPSAGGIDPGEPGKGRFGVWHPLCHPAAQP